MKYVHGKIALLISTIFQTANMHTAKKKEISWGDSEYQDKVQLQEIGGGEEKRGTRSQARIFLEQKASVGPCFQPGMPFEGPSGITICLPKKSMRNINENQSNKLHSGINIAISKKCLATKIKSQTEHQRKPNGQGEMIRDENCTEDNKDSCKFFGLLKEKLDTMGKKIKNVLNV